MWCRKTVVLVLATITLSIVAGVAWAGIEGSKHDFSRKEWAGGDTCGACHSPHRSQAPKVAPLWDPGADLTRRFGSSIGTGKTAGQGTLMCVRCHDGTIAPETITGVRGVRFRNKFNPGMFSGGHGRSDHPVAVDYPQFDKGFRPMTSVLSSQTVRLPNAKVECVSCHDPHNQSNLPHMLVKSNARSALCLTCHKK